MKLTTIRRNGGTTPAALLDNGKLLDLANATKHGALAGPAPESILDCLKDGRSHLDVQRLIADANGANGSVLDRLAAANAILEFDEAEFAPLVNPRLLLCGGMAYREHMTEMGVGMPTAPTAFLKSPMTIIGHNQSILLPRQAPDMVDFECEFSCVIGRRMHNVEPQDVMKHIAGYTMVNDIGSRRMVPEWLASMESGPPMKCVGLQSLSLLDKQFPTFSPMGPVLVSADELGDPADVSVETRLNGEIMQSSHTSDLIFPIEYSLSYFSRWYQFEPGDVFTTGSPSGVGFARNPPVYLKSGDVVVVSGSRTGSLSNPVAAR